MARRLVVAGPTPLLDPLTAAGGGLDLSRSLDLGLKPSGAGSVMASRAAVQPNENDYFPTPPWAARAGAELIRWLDPGNVGVCWEPAAGGGHMVHALEDYFGRVMASDIEVYAGAPERTAQIDFLQEDIAGPPADWIVTNPPFKLGEAFIRTAWSRARRGVAMLLRLQFIEGGARHALFTRDCPLTLFAPFSERVPMVAGRWDPEISSATAYGWFVFLKPEAAAQSPLASTIAAAREAGCGLVRPIGPGTKARLQRHADLVQFGLTPAETLFSGGGD